MPVKSILGQLLFENKAELPDLDSIDLGVEQMMALASNAAALPGAQDLATRVNSFNQAELLKSLRSTIPNYDEIVKQASSNIASGLRGEIPDGVQKAVQNFSAARSLGSTGQPLFDYGSGRKLADRDLGIASLDITNKALDSATKWLATGRTYLTAPQMDLSSMFITPMQKAQFDVNERNTRWNYDWFKNQAAAQPEPWQAAVGGLLDWVANTGLGVATFGIGSALEGLRGAPQDPDRNAPGSGGSGKGFFGGGSAWG